MKKIKVEKLRKSYKRKGGYVFLLLLMVFCISPVLVHASDQGGEDKDNEVVYTYTIDGLTGKIYKPHKHKRIYSDDPVDFRKKLHVNVHITLKGRYEELNNFHIWKEKGKTGKDCIAIWDSKHKNASIYKSTGLNKNKYLKICGDDWKKRLVTVQKEITENATEFLGKVLSAEAKKQWIAMIKKLFAMLIILAAARALFALCLI